VLTKADIPPGGEGEIKVTFNSGHKKGQQNKTVTVTSNDPDNPTTKIHVHAFIEVQFGFEPYSISFGKVRADEPVTKIAKLKIKDPETVSVGKITTSSEYISARVVPPANGNSDMHTVDVEVTLDPMYPPSNIRESVSIAAIPPTVPSATLNISGEVIGDIKLEPSSMRYVRYMMDSTKSIMVQSFKITNLNPDVTFDVTEMRDPAGRLQLSKTILPNNQGIEITAVLDPLKVGRQPRIMGKIEVTINHPKYKHIEEEYVIFNRK